MYECAEEMGWSGPMCQYPVVITRESLPDPSVCQLVTDCVTDLGLLWRITSQHTRRGQVFLRDSFYSVNIMYS